MGGLCFGCLLHCLWVASFSFVLGLSKILLLKCSPIPVECPHWVFIFPSLILVSFFLCLVFLPYNFFITCVSNAFPLTPWSLPCLESFLASAFCASLSCLSYWYSFMIYPLQGKLCVLVSTFAGLVPSSGCISGGTIVRHSHFTSRGERSLTKWGLSWRTGRLSENSHYAELSKWVQGERRKLQMGLCCVPQAHVQSRFLPPCQNCPCPTTLSVDQEHFPACWLLIPISGPSTLQWLPPVRICFHQWLSNPPWLLLFDPTDQRGY